MDLLPVAAVIEQQFHDRVTNVRQVRGNEVHCEVAAGALAAFAAHLRDGHGLDLWLMAAEDCRRLEGYFRVHYLFVHQRANWFVHASVRLPEESPTVESLALFSYPASRFEREMFDLFGIAASGHPDPRPLVRHGFWPADYFPLRWDARAPDFKDDGSPFPFGEVRGEGVYEIPVGPVHAGVIEPGHFRFSVLGETIIDLKSRLYFTHKGTEKLFEGHAPQDRVELAERVSGDSSVAHALAYCQAVERATETPVSDRAKFIRVALLELERIYNHVNDFGAIANDTGFAVAHAHCLRLREQLFRLNQDITGSRLLRGGVCVGGVQVDLKDAAGVAGRVDAVVKDFDEVVELTLTNTLVADRLRGTGHLSRDIAADHHVLGFVARASGMDVDARRDHPCAAYDRLSFRVPIFETGDVEARTLVRVEEVRESAGLIRQVMAGLPAGPLAVRVPDAEGETAAFSIVEGWRGAVSWWVRIMDDQRLARVKIVDPSFLNWKTLSYAVLDNIVPDFPLCNKSFNQSYSGNDL